MSKILALVVEDDLVQRMVLSDLLQDRGLEVAECSTAEAAELVLVSTGNELRALVTDVSLAGAMSGIELAQFAKRKFPRVNVVMVSGQWPSYVPHNVAFLLKPYRPHELLDAVFS